MTIIKNLVEYFVKFPILANILIALTLIGGLVAMFSTQKSFFPTRSDRNITISVSYPGASPEEMEEGVTLKIEEAINPIAGIDEIISTSSENSARITIINGLEEGTNLVIEPLIGAYNNMLVEKREQLDIDLELREDRKPQENGGKIQAVNKVGS